MDYIYTNKPIKQAALATVGVLRAHLYKGERVLWLLSGGSSLAIANIVSKSKRLRDLDLSKLYISITDERYGPVGHADENWQHLLDSGFNMPGANLYRPLIGATIEETTAAFNNWLETQFTTANYKLGIFGLGTDGHTAGIKPNSTATESIDLATHYKADDFERITISFIAIKLLDEAVIQASGDSKQLIVRELTYDGYPMNERPSQILKKIPISTLYTNISKVS